MANVFRRTVTAVREREGMIRVHSNECDDPKISKEEFGCETWIAGVPVGESIADAIANGLCAAAGWSEGQGERPFKASEIIVMPCTGEITLEEMEQRAALSALMETILFVTRLAGEMPVALIEKSLANKDLRGNTVKDAVERLEKFGFVMEIDGKIRLTPPTMMEHES